MRSSSPLPWPQEWPRSRGGGHVAAVACLVVLGSLAIAAGLGFVAIGRSSALKYSLLFAALLFLSALHGYLLKVAPRYPNSGVALVRHDGDQATELRYASTLFGILVALMACLTALAALAAVDFFRTDEKVPAAPVGGMLFGAATLFLASFLIAILTGRITRGRIVLSRRGIHQRGRAFTSFLPWEAFAGIKAAYNGSPQVLVIAYSNTPWQRRQITKVWKLDQLPPIPMIEIDCTVLAVEPALVYQLIKFYLDHPTMRAELGTDASLNRVRTGNFTQLTISG